MYCIHNNIIDGRKISSSLQCILLIAFFKNVFTEKKCTYYNFNPIDDCERHCIDRESERE